MGVSVSKIWTVRSISDDIQKRVSDAAQAAGMRLGPFVERILLDALEPSEGKSAPEGQGDAGDFAAQLAALAERVERLEAAQAVPAIPDLLSRDGDGSKGRRGSAIPSRQGSALDAVDPARGTKGSERQDNVPERPYRSIVGRNNRAIADDHLEEAHQLQANGESFAKIIEAKGWPYSPTGLANAVARWRGRQKLVPTENPF